MVIKQVTAIQTFLKHQAMFVHHGLLFGFIDGDACVLLDWLHLEADVQQSHCYSNMRRTMFKWYMDKYTHFSLFICLF